MNQTRGSQQTIMLIVGITIAAAGILFTLDNLDILGARPFVRYWPIALIAIGLVQFMQSETPAARVRGTIWLAFGTFLFGRALGLWYFRPRDIGPLLLIALGGSLVWRALRPPEESPVTAEGVLSATAILGGFDRRVINGALRRAELTAFMGGGKVDLTDATLPDGRAVIEVFGMMGGFEIIVPRGWKTIVEVTPILGGTDDKTRDTADPGAPTLLVRGFIVMGGVEIKN
jgi:hypothetical protein